MALKSKVLKIVGITVVLSSSACAAPGIGGNGKKWPNLNYSQEENKLPIIQPKQIPLPNTGEDMGAKPAQGEHALFESLIKERNNWRAKMGGQRSIYLNAKDKTLAAKPEKSRNAWMTAQLQLTRLSQLGDDMLDLISKVESHPESPALENFKNQLNVHQQSLFNFLSKEQEFLAKVNPNW